MVLTHKTCTQMALRATLLFVGQHSNWSTTQIHWSHVELSWQCQITTNVSKHLLSASLFMSSQNVTNSSPYILSTTALEKGQASA